MRLSVLAHALSPELVPSLAAARAGGFDGIVLDPTAFPEIADASQTGRREIVHRIDREGLSLVGVDVKLAATGFSPRGDVQRELDRLSRAIDIARGLRCTLVLCDLGPLPPAPDEPVVPRVPIPAAALGKLILPEMPKAEPPPSVPRDLAFESSLETALRELADRADRAGCLIAFRSSLGSFASVARALSSVDCGYFGVDLDTLSILADTWDADAVFSALGGHIRHMRARDGNRGAGGRVVPTEIGKGEIYWRQMSSLCRDADFDGFLTLDTIDLQDRRGAAVRGAKTLRDQTR